MVGARARRILEETQRCAPEVWEALGTTLEALASGFRVPRSRLESAYRRVKPISFDHAVLERSRRVLVVQGRFRWSDLGSWDALGEHLPVVEDNRVRGPRPAALVDSSRNVIWNTTDKALALLGVRDLIVVETPDALLVCSKERAQDVRRIVDELIRKRRTDLA